MLCLTVVPSRAWIWRV